MNYFVAVTTKDDQLHIRMKPDVKEDLQTLAESRGLTMSSFVHSLIVQAIRAEKNAEPGLFRKNERIVNGNVEPVDDRVVYVRNLGELTDERKQKPIRRKAGRK